MFRSILSANSGKAYLVSQTKRRITNAVSMYMLTIMDSSNVSDADDATDDKDPKDKQKGVGMPDLFDSAQLTYFGGQLSVGALLGYSAGYAINVTAHVAAYFVGVVFISIQYLSWRGMVKVQWQEILDQADRSFAKT